MAAPSYLALSQNTAAHPNPYTADVINNASALHTLSMQQQQQADLERQYRAQWWKRGLAKGALGAVTGAISGIAGGPAGMLAGAGAGLAGGFGGEALNHAAFQDQNGAIGNAGAALGGLAAQGVGSYLRQQDENAQNQQKQGNWGMMGGRAFSDNIGLNEDGSINGYATQASPAGLMPGAYSPSNQYQMSPAEYRRMMEENGLQGPY